MGKIIRPIHNNIQPLTRIIVSALKINHEAKVIEMDQNRISKICNGLIDTGATNSVISKRLIEELKLEPKGKTKVHTASHDNHEVYKYEIVLCISLDEKPIWQPNGLNIKSNWLQIPLTVTNGSFEKQNFDVLIGMDVISKGHLSISEGLFIFSI